MMKQTFFITLTLLLLMAGNLTAQRAKSVSILGDSYSTYEGFVEPDSNLVWYWQKETDPKRTDVRSVRQTWWQQFIRDNGYLLCVNNSYSGATISYSGYKRGKPEHPDYSDRSFITRVDRLGCPDILFIFGGTNDSWAGAPLGEYQYADWTHKDLFAFRPALACLLQKVTDRYPNVAIYFVLNDGLKPEINASAKALCAHYGVPCIELKGIDKMSGHPSVKGMTQIKEQIEAFLAAEKK